MRRKIIPVLIAMILIIIIAVVGFGSVLVEKYSYSKERVELADYYEVSDGELAIVLQDEILPEKALWKDGICYFTLDTVHAY